MSKDRKGVVVKEIELDRMVPVNWIGWYLSMM